MPYSPRDHTLETISKELGRFRPKSLRGVSTFQMSTFCLYSSLSPSCVYSARRWGLETTQSWAPLPAQPVLGKRSCVRTERSGAQGDMSHVVTRDFSSHPQGLTDQRLSLLSASPAFPGNSGPLQVPFLHSTGTPEACYCHLTGAPRIGECSQDGHPHRCVPTCPDPGWVSGPCSGKLSLGFWGRGGGGCSKASSVPLP